MVTIGTLLSGKEGAADSGNRSGSGSPVSIRMREDPLDLVTAYPASSADKIARIDAERAFNISFRTGTWLQTQALRQEDQHHSRSGPKDGGLNLHLDAIVVEQPFRKALRLGQSDGLIFG